MASWLSLSIFMLQYSFGIVIIGKFILSCCLCVIDLWVADLALHPVLGADLAGRQGYLFTDDRHLYYEERMLKNLKHRHLSRAWHLIAQHPTCPNPSITGRPTAQVQPVCPLHQPEGQS